MLVANEIILAKHKTLIFRFESNRQARFEFLQWTSFEKALVLRKK